MPEEQIDSPALSTGDGAIPRLKFSETGIIGLKQINGIILEENRKELSWPYATLTYKAMSNDPTINNALTLIESMIARVEWDVEPPENATPEQEARAEFVEQCMRDMEHSWFSFIKEVCSVLTYGFDVHEKVYRKRYKKNGSKYNDGLVGLKAILPRSQETISKWNFSEDGQKLTGATQALNNISDGYGRFSTLMSKGVSEITIPREKFLLFRTDAKKDNPEGRSILRNLFTTWQYRIAVEEDEAVGVKRDMRGIPILRMPPRYMAADASEEDKAVYTYMQKVLRNIQNNEQAGLIIPAVYDEQTKQPLFDFELLGIKGTGTKNYDTNQIITRLETKMLMAFFADILRMGNDKVGSFALAGSKTSILAVAIEHRLKEIQDVLNQDLIPQLFALNGWEETEYPKFVYGDLEDQDLQDFSAAIQRCAATTTIAKTPGNINYIAEQLGLPDRVDEEMSQEELNKLLGVMTSRSGDGLVKGTGNGTSDTVSADDNSISNTNN